MTTPQQFANIGLDTFTQWVQDTERLITFAATYEARLGATQFENAKHQAPPGGELTAEQLAENAELDHLAAAALAVVTHHNELMQWYDAGKRQRAGIWRTDL